MIQVGCKTIFCIKLLRDQAKQLWGNRGLELGADDHALAVEDLDLVLARGSPAWNSVRAHPAPVM